MTVLSVVTMWFLLTGELLKILNKFYKRNEMQKIAADQGLDGENNNHFQLVGLPVWYPHQTYV